MVEFPKLSELRAKAQPGEVLARRNAEHWSGRLYLRHLSIYVTRILVPTGISANGVTWLMALIGLAGAAILVTGKWWALLVCALLMQLQVLVDCSDGEVARWRGTSSASGIYIDRIGHYLTESFLPIGFGIYADGGIKEVGLYTMLGLVTSVIVLLNKSFGDLVHTSRAAYGLPPLKDDGAKSAPRPSGLRRIRSALRFAPFFRAFVAVEFSLIILAIGTVDAVFDFEGRALQVGAIVLAPAAAIIMMGRVTAILTSERLKS